jgi:hypothetical protein
MADKIIGLLTGCLAGYLIGLLAGFTLFDPNLDVWALLGAVGGVLGLIVGLTPFFRRRIRVVLAMVLGFYGGGVLGLLLFGNFTDDMYTQTHNVGWWVFVLIGIIAGGILGSRFLNDDFKLPLFVFAFGGFLGGMLLNLAFNVPPQPAAIVSGLVLGGLALLRQKRSPDLMNSV